MLIPIENILIPINDFPQESKFLSYKESGSFYICCLKTRDSWSGFSCVTSDFQDHVKKALTISFHNLVLRGCVEEAKEFKELYYEYIGILEAEPIFTIPAYLKV